MVVLDNGTIRAEINELGAEIRRVTVGGEDKMSNYQTMCLECNNLKGNDDISLNDLKKRVKKYRKMVYRGD